MQANDRSQQLAHPRRLLRDAATGEIDALTLGYAHNFARITATSGDYYDIEFDLKADRWPWLALPPWHPVLMNKYQYFAAMSASWAAGILRPGVHTALTKLSWTCDPSLKTLPPWGRCGHWRRESNMGFQLSLGTPDAPDQATMEGTGHTFEDRDFGAWRNKSKQSARALAAPRYPFPAALDEVGLAPQGVRFVGELHDATTAAWVQALVPATRGFFPGHPFHTGTGDHVNAGHQFDCALQAAHLLLADRWQHTGLICRQGEATFNRFVELDAPFVIHMRERPSRDAQACIEFVLSQGDRDNALITLSLEPNQ